MLYKALKAPMRKLAENAGHKGEVIVENRRMAQREHADPQVGFNVLSGEYVNMVQAGIIDLAKVSRGALENAASIRLLRRTRLYVGDARRSRRDA